MNKLKLYQKLGKTFKCTLSERADEFMSDPCEVASFLIKKSKGDGWHRRCLSPIQKGDYIKLRGDIYNIVSAKCEGRTIPDSDLKLRSKLK